MRRLSPKTPFLFYSLSSSSSSSSSSSYSSLLSSARPVLFIFQASHFSTSFNYSSLPHSSSKRHDEDSRNVKVSVWWDFENCSMPCGVNVYKVAHAITAAVRSNGIKGPVQLTAFGDMLQLSRANQEALSSTGVNLSHIPHGGKNSADRSLLLDLMYWVSQNPPPAHLFLISGDRDFASILHRLRMNNYNILLASPESAPGVLCSAATIMWHWHDLLRGQNLNGKHFNQPPDGPYGSWYGHYKLPLLDPFSDTEQAALPPTEESTELGSESKLRSIPKPVVKPIRSVLNSNPKGLTEQAALPPTEESTELGSESKLRSIPKSVVKQIRSILNSNPKGLPITDLRVELQKSNPSIDRDLYGYKKFSRFLLSMPHILRLKSEGDGHFMVHGVPSKSSESFECKPGISVGPVSKNENPDLNIRSNVSADGRSVNGGTDKKTSPEKLSITTSPDLQQPSFPNEKAVEMVNNPLESESHLPSVIEQDSASDVGYFKRIWRNWFGSNSGGSENKNDKVQEKYFTSDNGSEKRQTTAEKHCVSDDSYGKGKDEENNLKSSDQVVDQACPPSSSSHNKSSLDDRTTAKAEVNYNMSNSSPGIFNRLLSWYNTWRSIPSSDKLSDHSHDKPNLNISHCGEHELFSKDSFWSDMESFVFTPKGSFLVSESRTREQMAHNLQKEGPLDLRSLSKVDLLRLVDLLISDKKWVEECPSKMLPFKLTHCVGKNSPMDRPRGSNGLRSIFMDTSSLPDMQSMPEHNREGRFQNVSHPEVSPPDINKKPSGKPKSKAVLLADCQKLVNETLKDHPEGYNISSFKKLFLKRFGYNLDYQRLGYEKLASLLQTMPGVKIESCYILPSKMVPNINLVQTLASSTHESSGAPMKDDNLVSKKDSDSDSAWEELGPVSNEKSNQRGREFLVSKRAVEPVGRKAGFNYEPSVSDDDFSDSEGDASPVPESEGKRKIRVDTGESALLQILDSWYTNKEGDNSKDKSENLDGMVDCSTNIAKLPGGKHRPQKGYSFVADPVSSSNQDKLVDGVLCNLRKSSESRVEG